MNTETIKPMLAWSLVINYVILILWFLVFIFAYDWFRDMHARWFHLTAEQFAMANYLGLIFYKLGIMLFNLAPYLALRIVERRKA
jgi:hypothetical protein